MSIVTETLCPRTGCNSFYDSNDEHNGDYLMTDIYILSALIVCIYFVSCMYLNFILATLSPHWMFLTSSGAFSKIILYVFSYSL